MRANRHLRFITSGLICFYCLMIMYSYQATVHAMHDSIIRFQLPDNTPANYKIGNINSQFKLGSSVSRVVILPPGSFDLKLNGDIYTTRVVDRDDVCSQFNCCQNSMCQIKLNSIWFMKQDSSEPIQLTIHITLNDENDNAPKFNVPLHNQCWHLNISESSTIGTRFKLPEATDADSLRHGIRRYQLKKERYGIPFRLIELQLNKEHSINRPQLELIRPLDREKISEYKSELIVEDYGLPPSRTILPLCINVDDINDHAPIFSQAAPNRIEIKEDEIVGSVLYKFQATDSDDGRNGEIEFSLMLDPYYLMNTKPTNIDKKLIIEPQTGELILRENFDYEDEYERTIHLIIKAADRGVPSLSSTSALILQILDANDNDPSLEFLPDTNEKTGTQFKENDPTRRVLKLFTVSDPDSVSTGKVKCSPTSQYLSSFVLKPYQDLVYGIINRRAFDYETDTDKNGMVQLTIECADNAFPGRLSKTNIAIKLKNLNDNWPTFTQNVYKFHVPEDAPIGVVIGEVKAVDADRGVYGELKYALLMIDPDSAASHWFTVDRNTGKIFVHSPLDRETVESVEFNLTATDSHLENDGQISKSNWTQVQIYILDVNDNPPIYKGSNVINITEDTSLGMVIVQDLMILDTDKGQNGSVYVSVLESSGYRTMPHEHIVIVEESKRLILSRQMDREKQTEHIIYLLAEDQGRPVSLSSTFSLTLRITDVNDNAPILMSPPNGSWLNGLLLNSEWSVSKTLTSIPVNVPRATLIATIRGDDVDYGANGTVRYRLNNFTNNNAYRDGFDYFHIDQKHGYLTTAWNEGIISDRPTPQPGSYQLNVIIHDCGTPPRENQFTFYVNISRSIGSSFGLNLFPDIKMTDGIVVVVISICSLLLITCLIGAIIWVRSRANSSEQQPGPIRDYQSANGFNNYSNGYVVSATPNYYSDQISDYEILLKRQTEDVFNGNMRDPYAQLKSQKISTLSPPVLTPDYFCAPLEPLPCSLMSIFPHASTLYTQHPLEHQMTYSTGESDSGVDTQSSWQVTYIPTCHFTPSGFDSSTNQDGCPSPTIPSCVQYNLNGTLSYSPEHLNTEMFSMKVSTTAIEHASECN